MGTICCQWVQIENFIDLKWNQDIVHMNRTTRYLLQGFYNTVCNIENIEWIAFAPIFLILDA